MIYPLSRLLTVTAGGQALLTQVVQALDQAGWQAVQSFDLQGARQAHTTCTCPHHGTGQCSCQMSILLLYEASAASHPEPLTLIIHGRDGYTEFSLVAAGQPASSVRRDVFSRLAAVLRSAINPPALNP